MRTNATASTILKMLEGVSPSEEVTRANVCSTIDTYHALIETMNPKPDSLPKRIPIQFEAPKDYKGKPVIVYLGRENVLVPDCYMEVKDMANHSEYSFRQMYNKYKHIRGDVMVSPSQAALICYAYCMHMSGRTLKKLPSNYGSGYLTFSFAGRTLRSHVEEYRF